MSLLCDTSVWVFFFVIIPLISAFSFQYQINGKILWSPDCDYPNFDFASVRVPNTTCGDICANRNQCTHFTWVDEICYLKHFPSGYTTPIVLNGAFCGHIVKIFSWKDGSKTRLKWSVDCDFIDSDIGSISSSRDECVDHCAKNSHCTHFTWVKNECYLKQIDSGSIKPIALDNAVCGYVVKFFRWDDIWT